MIPAAEIIQIAYQLDALGNEIYKLQKEQIDRNEHKVYKPLKTPKMKM